ncbi:hypothetical protein [Wenjunlia tyrosinilytica]|uniref:DUF485 domain-containing protein n=1 Tax=Wenjunlia tyrosinilytica TaxID=1544741 RepID=A0A918DZ25_9ACTN|nr:hypothetical protein [Wenjunlia tyrosinilytica]GGO89074.1 hypothetical protein GCM10012280_31370 [Wenjunlia tyrosinilytica]
MSVEPAPRREVVTGVPRRTARMGRPVRTQSEINEQTTLGAAYVRSLMRSQLRAGLAAFAVLAVVLGSLPVVFSLLPSDLSLWPAGPTLVWAVLGAAAYPFMIVIARWYVRRAERNERDFADLVE